MRVIEHEKREYEYSNELLELEYNLKKLRLKRGYASSNRVKREFGVEISALAEKKMEMKVKVIKKEEEKAVFKKCPSEGCKGLYSGKRCDICESEICQECNKVKLEGHVCNPDDIEMVKYLAKDTKQCPKCFIGIQKIDGCDQMWCTECRTAFSWKTLKIDGGMIHNPHALEYMRRHGQVIPRAVGDVLCGREFDNNLIQRITAVASDETVYLLRMLVHAIHVQERVYPDLEVRFNEDLRKEYLKNEIDEKKFKTVIFSRNKKHAIDREERQIKEMWVENSKELFFRLDEKTWITNCKELSYNPKDEEAILEELYALEEYANECLKDVCALYKIKRRYVIYRSE